jgi:hypothetical protein
VVRKSQDDHTRGVPRTSFLEHCLINNQFSNQNHSCINEGYIYKQFCFEAILFSLKKGFPRFCDSSRIVQLQRAGLSARDSRGHILFNENKKQLMASELNDEWAQKNGTSAFEVECESEGTRH